MNNKCIYYVEGPCEQQLIAALKETPARLIPGKVKVFNVVQNLIPKSQMLSIQAGTTVVLVFDTDVSQTSNLKKNLELLTRYCGKLKIIFLPQVLNLENEHLLSVFGLLWIAAARLEMLQNIIDNLQHSCV